MFTSHATFGGSRFCLGPAVVRCGCVLWLRVVVVVCCSCVLWFCAVVVSCGCVLWLRLCGCVLWMRRCDCVLVIVCLRLCL